MNLYRLNLNLLIALDALFIEQSVTHAAKKLFISQAAMSNNLQQLREIFKDDLLIREKNHMVLTSYAKELQPKLHQVLEEVRCLVVSGQCFNAKTSERIFKIGISDYIAALLLPGLIACLQQKAPGIKIAIISVYHLANNEPLEKGDYDLAIGKIFDVTPPIRKHLLFKDKAVCILNHKHVLAKKKNITLKEYLSHKHVAIRVDNPHFPPLIEQALMKQGHRRDIQVALPFIVPIFKLIEQSENLIATVLKNMTLLYQDNHRYIIKPLPFKIPDLEFYLTWHQRFDNDPGHKWLRQQFIEIGSELAA